MSSGWGYWCLLIDEGSLLAIVTSQRERLKQRNMELEAVRY